MKLAVEIEVVQTGNGFALVNNGLVDVAKNAKQAGQGAAEASSGLADMVKQLSLVATVAGPFLLLKKAITAGVEYNAILETSRLGLGAIIAQTGTLEDVNGRVLAGTEKFNKALEISTRLQKDLQKAALESAATYEQLLSGVQAAVPLAVARGFDTKQIVEFTKLASQAAAAIDPMLLKEGQFSQEIRGIFEGDMSRASRLARIVFSDFKGDAASLQEKMAELQKQGKLFDFLKERLGAFGEAGERSMNTLTVAASNFKDAYTQAMGSATLELTHDLTKALNDIVSSFTEVDSAGRRAFRPELVEDIRNIADILGAVAGALVKVVTLFPDFQHALEQSSDAIHHKLVTLLEDLGAYTSAAITGHPGIRPQQIADNQRREDATNTRAANADFFTRTVGQGGKLLGFPDLGEAGKQLASIANTEGPVYLDFLKRIKVAAKDGTVTQIEYARAVIEARKALAGDKLGTGHPTPDDAANKAKETGRVEAFRKLVEAGDMILAQEDKMIGLGAQITRQSKNQLDTAQAQADLDMLNADAYARKLDVLTKQLAIERRLADLAKERVRDSTSAELVSEDYRHLAELKKIADLQGSLLKGVAPDANGVQRIHGTARLDRQGILQATGEAAELAAKITEARSREDENYTSKREALKQAGRDKETQLDIEAQTRRNAILLAMWAEEYKQILGLAQGVNDGVHAGLMELFQSGSTKKAAQAFADTIRQALAGMFAGNVDEWFKSIQKQATLTSGHWTTDANGKSTWKQGTRGNAAEWGVTGAAALGAGYGLYQQAKTATRGETVTSGALQGAQLGSAAGPWGAVAGAVIGAAYGAVFSAIAQGSKARYQVTVGTDGKINVTGFNANQSDVDAAVQTLNATLASAMAAVHGIINAFPAAIAKMLRADTPDVLSPGMIGTAVEKVRTFRISIYKKSLAGGFTADQLKHFNEVELPQLVYDAYAPLFESGLKQLGVTEAKLKELFARGPGFDPKAALAKLQGFVEVLTGFAASDAFNKLNAGELMAKSSAEIGATPLQAIVKQGEKLKELADGFSTLSTEEQITRGKEILSLETQRQQSILQYLHAIKTAQDALFKSIDAQVAGIGLDTLGPAGQADALRARLADRMGKIGSAATPDELSALGGEIQGLVGQIYELTKVMPAQLKGLIDGLKGLDEVLAPGKTPGEKLADLSRKIFEAGDRLTNAKGLDDQVKAAQDVLNLTQQKFALERQMLDEINAAIAGMNKSIDKQIGDMTLQGKITALGPNADPATVANLQINDLLAKQRGLRDELKGATTATEVQRIVSELQSNASSLFDLMGKTPEAAAQLTKMLEDVRTQAADRFKEFAEQIVKDNDAIRGRVTAAVAILETALAGLPTAAKEATDALAVLREALAARFTELTDQVVAANLDIMSTIEEILNALRNGIDGIFGTETGAGAGTGGAGTGGGRGGRNGYRGPDAGAPPAPIVVVADVGAPVVYVNLAGSAEALIDSVVARAEMAGAVRAVSAIAQQRARRSSF